MNNQQITKIINYFRINHGYHSPYTFILDGNFLKLLVEKDLNLEEKLKPIITGKIRIKVTNCMLSELEILGRDFAIIHQKGKQYQPIKCSHPFQAVDRCIIDHVDKGKEENVVVCTQDCFLRRKLRGRKVALMYFGPDQRVTMEDVERHQFMNMKEAEKQKFLPSSYEMPELEKFKEQEKLMQKIKRRNERYKLAASQGKQLKYLKKAKAPNPLSMKKKQKRPKNNRGQSQSAPHAPEQARNVSSNQDSNLNVGNVQKTKRIRKRKNKNKQNAMIEE